MLIDWFTVGAQVVNFLILVWLLKRFLYKPILHAVDEREKSIALRIQDADAKKVDAQKEGDAFRRMSDELDQKRGALLSSATEEANAERQRLIEEAQQESEALRTQFLETLRNEQQLLGREITVRTQQEVFAIVRKTLTDLATVSLEETMGDVFIRRLHQLNGAEKGQLTSVLKASVHPTLVRSAFDLPPATKVAVESAIKETLAAETPIRFETRPDLVSGIELTTNGHKVAWNIADYLASMEKSIGDLLAEKPEPELQLEK